MVDVSKAGFTPDRNEYPFTSRTFAGKEGKLHYVDEGQGRPIVFVHGTPTWSFLYRRLIRHFAQTHRCIAVDHLGFGLSEKVENASYAPADHARRLEEFLMGLGLRDVTLVVHDFGGPIGLAFAERHPETIHSLVLFNTWGWSNRDDLSKVRLARLVSGRLGAVLYCVFNLSLRVLLPLCFARKDLLTRKLKEAYFAPFPRPRHRKPLLALARHLLSDWFEEIWRNRGPLQDKPTLLVWGLKDLAFGPDALARWQSFFRHAHTVTLPEAGHFPQEEAPHEVTQALETFLDGGT